MSHPVMESSTEERLTEEKNGKSFFEEDLRDFLSATKSKSGLIYSDL